MPYIKREQREELEPELGALIQKMLSMPEFHSNGRAGILNYVITDMLDSCFGPLSNAKYRDYNEAIGMLECCKLEFYRKAAAPYEDMKEKENGKVLDGETRKPPKPASVKITPTEMMMTKPNDGFDKIMDPGLVDEIYNIGFKGTDEIKTKKIISKHLSYIFNPELTQSITDCGKRELEKQGIYFGNNFGTVAVGNHKIIGNCSSSLEASYATKLLIAMKEKIESGLGNYMKENPEMNLTGEFTVLYTVKDNKEVGEVK